MSTSLVNVHIDDDMPRYTEKEIMKGLEVCMERDENYPCNNCPFEYSGCTAAMSKAVIDLIDRKNAENKEKDEIINAQGSTIRHFTQIMTEKTAEIEALNKAKKKAATTTMGVIKRLDAEVERLKSMNQAKLDMIHDLRAELETAKTEVVKKIIEHLEAEITISDKSVHKYNDSKDITYNNSLRETLRIVKEMAGER